MANLGTWVPRAVGKRQGGSTPYLTAPDLEQMTQDAAWQTDQCERPQSPRRLHIHATGR